MPPSPVLRWLPVVAAVGVSLPALLPGAEAYLDNAPHLLELRVLADEVLPGDRWFTGWTDAFEAGSAVGQINAPLAWIPLAALIALGAPLAPTYALAAVLANVVLAVGAARLGARLTDRPTGPALGAVLAVASIPELYGVGGSLGGMWPYRLALGVMAWGLGAPAVERGAARIAAWVGGILLLHTFAGLLVAGWVVVSAGMALARGDRAAAGRWALGAALAALATSVFWGPLLDGRVREFPHHTMLTPLRALVYVFTPVDPGALLLRRGPLLESGYEALPAFVLAWIGLLAVVRARPHSPGELVRRLGLASAVLVGALLLMGALDSNALGPNPWRYAALLHLLGLVAGGVGLSLWVRRPWAVALAGFTLVLASWRVADRELPHRVDAEHADGWNAYEATWDALAAASPTGRIFHEDPNFDPEAPEPFGNSHAGSLFTLRTGLPHVGSWYGVNPIPSSRWLTSEGIYTMGGWDGPVSAHREVLHQRFRLFGIGGLVTHSREVTGILMADPRYRRVGGEGGFHAFVTVDPALDRLGVPPAVGSVRDLRVARGAIDATVEAAGGHSGPIAVRFRSAYHPWWIATLDGQEVEVQHDPTNGMMSVELPRGGALSLRFEVRGKGWLGVSLMGLALLMLAWRRGDRPPAPG